MATTITGRQIRDSTITVDDISSSAQEQFAKTKVSSGDTTTDYLSNKIVAGPNIVINVVNTGSYETFAISASLSGAAVTALNNAVTNRLVTIGSPTTELDGEADLTFDGTTFSITASMLVDGNMVIQSVTGAFLGDLTGTASEASQVSSTLSDGTGITTFSFNGSSPATVAIDESIVVTLTGSQTLSNKIVSGSFSGSFVGDGSGITGVTAEWDGTHVGDAQITGTLYVTEAVEAPSFTGSLLGDVAGTASFATEAGQVSNELTDGTGITDFTFDGSSAATVSIDETIVVTLTGSQTLSNKIVSGSFSGSYVGDGSGLTGVTAEWDGTHVGDAQITGTLYVTEAVVAQSVTASFLGDLVGTASEASKVTNALVDGTGITDFTFDGSSPATVSIDETIVATLTGSQTLSNKIVSGSFSGSYVGDGSGLTGVTAEWDGTHVGDAQITGTLYVTEAVEAPSFTGSLLGDVVGTASFATEAGKVSNALVDGTGITDFTFDGSAPATVSIDESIVVTLTGSQTLTNKIITGSFSGSFVGDGSGLTGISSSAAGSSSEVQFNTGGILDASPSLTFDGTILKVTSSIEAASITASFLGDLAGTASEASKVSNALVDGTGITNFSFDGSSAATVSIDESIVVTLTGSQTLTNKIITGSFSGSFVGDGSGLTNVTASAAGSTNEIQFNTGGILDASPSLVFSGSVLKVTSSIETTSITGSLLGNVIGTASFATEADKVSNTLVDGTGITNFSFDGSAPATVSIDESIVVTLTGSQTLSNKIVSGSFSGSYVGDGSGLTGVTAEWDGTHVGDAQITGTLYVTEGVVAQSFTGSLLGDVIGTSSFATEAGKVSNALTDGTGITNFSFDGSAPATVSIDESIVVTLTGSQTLSNKIVSGSFSGSFVGDGSGLTGITAEWDGTHVGDAQITGTLYVTEAVEATSFTGSLLGDVVGTASFATEAAKVSNALTDGTGITNFSFDGSAPATVSIDETIVVTLTGSQTLSNKVVSGSFSGSFVGDGSGLTGVTAEWDGTHVGDAQITGTLYVTEGIVAQSVTASFLGDLVGTSSEASKVTNALTDGTGITDFTFDGSSPATVSIDESIVVTLTGSQTLSNKVVSGSFSGSFVGDGSGLTGVTAEWDGTHVGDAQITGTLYVTEGVVAQSFTGSLLGDVIGTASFATEAGKVSSTLTDGTGITNFSFDGSAPATVSIDETIVVTLTGSQTLSNKVVSGSFSGSYVGDGSGLTGVTAEWDGTHVGDAQITGTLYVTEGIVAQSVTASFLGDLVGTSSEASKVTNELTDGTGITDFMFDGSSPATVSIDESIVVTLTGSQTLSNKVVSGSFSGSFFGDGSGLTGVGQTAAGNSTEIQFNTGGDFDASSNLTFSGSVLKVTSSIETTSITGSLFGTASFATEAGKVSNALTDGTGITNFSYDGSVPASVSIDETIVVTLTGSQTLTNKIITGSFSGSFFGDGSFITNAQVSGSNLLWVDVSGSDASGTRERFDKPYASVGGALSSASAGDVVVVRPGTYEESITMVDGVSVVGMDRDRCILKKYGAGFAYAVTMADNCAFEHMSIDISASNGVSFAGTTAGTSAIRHTRITAVGGHSSGVTITGTPSPAENWITCDHVDIVGAGLSNAFYNNSAGTVNLRDCFGYALIGLQVGSTSTTRVQDCRFSGFTGIAIATASATVYADQSTRWSSFTNATGGNFYPDLTHLLVATGSVTEIQISSGTFLSSSANLTFSGSLLAVTGALSVTESVIAQSFTGSLLGDIIGTSSFATEAAKVSNALVDGTGITNFSFDGSSPTTVSIDESIVVTLTGSQTLSNKVVSGSFSGSFVGDGSGLTGVGGGGTPGGSNTQIQYNNAGAFGGSADFTFDSSATALALTGTFNGRRYYPNSATDPASPTPADSDIYYNTALDMQMIYDATRSKWLSVDSSIMEFGRSGNTGGGAYYRGPGQKAYSTDRGRTAEYNGTVVSITYTRNDLDAATFEVTADGTGIATLASSARTGKDITLNDDFSADEILGVKNQTGSNTTRGVTGWVRIRWRV